MTARALIFAALANALVSTAIVTGGLLILALLGTTTPGQAAFVPTLVTIVALAAAPVMLASHAAAAAISTFARRNLRAGLIAAAIVAGALAFGWIANRGAPALRTDGLTALLFAAAAALPWLGRAGVLKRRTA